MKQRIAGFDGLRAIAVLAVVANHKTQFGDAIGAGGWGVRLFFVLSGFLIIGILRQQRLAIEARSTSTSHELLDFYKNRLYRIWPIYFLVVGLAIFLGLISLWPRLGGVEIITLITFTSNIPVAYFWPGFPAHIGPLWSVAIEEQFYLWAAPVFLLTSTKRIIPICAAVVVVSILVATAHRVAGMSHLANYVGSLPNFGFMALGGIAAVYDRWPQWIGRFAPALLAAFLIGPLMAWYIGRTTVPAMILGFASGVLVAAALIGIVQSQGG